MKGKIKIILAVLSVISVLSFCSCGKSDNETTDIWESTPEVISFEDDTEPTYSSYEEPFNTAYNVKMIELSKENITIDSAYFITKGNSLAIESYVNPDGTYQFYVCKFRDGRMYTVTLESGLKKFTTNNNLLIDKDSDILILRYYIDKETIRQIIYDFTEDEYIAVRDRNYGYDDTDAMEAAVTEYNADAKNFLVYSDVAVKENVTAYIEKNLKVK